MPCGSQIALNTFVWVSVNQDPVPGAAAHHSAGGAHSLTWEEQTVFTGGQSNIGIAASSLPRAGFFLSYMADMERNNTKKENNLSWERIFPNLTLCKENAH